MNALGLAVQNVIPVTAWRDNASAHEHNWARQRSTEPEDFAVVPLLLYQNHCVSLLSRCGKLLGPSGLRPLCRGTLLVAMQNCFEPNFLSTCALCKIGDHGSKYIGFPYFRNLMEKEMRNKFQSEKLNTKPNNRQPNMGRARNSIQSIHPQ
jgi:hypothetical protein